MSADEPPSQEELIARAEALKRRADELVARLGPPPPSRPPQWLVFVRVLLAFPLPILLGNGVRELLRDARVQPGTQAGAQAAVTVLGIVAGVWLGFVLARRHERRALLAGPRLGTRAWEADQTAQLIERALADRRHELAAATGDRRARLVLEVAHLEPQLAEQRRIAASGDASPARGRIGFDLPA